MSDQEKNRSDYPSSEFRFFIYDHCNGDFTYYRTPEERDAAQSSPPAWAIPYKSPPN